MEFVNVSHAEITPQYGSQDALKEFKVEKGGYMVSFRVKTKVNDKIEKAPHLFRTCSIFVATDDELKRLKELVQVGNRVEIKGFTDTRKGKDRDGNEKYFEQIKVQEIIPIVVDNDTSNDEDNLPF